MPYIALFWCGQKRTKKTAPRTPVFPDRLLACSGDPAAGCPKRPICCVAGHRSSLRRTGSTSHSSPCLRLAPENFSIACITRWTRRVAATRAATANQKPWRAVVCGPQFQASGRLKRTALGAASQPLFAGKKWQKKLVYMVRIMSSDAVCVEPFRPLQHDIRVSADNLPFRGCETSVTC
ncbi:hypothetical protein Selin_2551 [Desulfurispirillum indicum S5]|uniref:Uncharacterized protein n=1 Tax=Desulfurispirillum indicum (strain ATCC BAA-1389 / DSM 22839 / S5) TaxID=653733 RepID=E6W5X8_DESIS|nr:hypothetical protein Selin_2551 [Desulfurispirillum indicum S5]